MIRKLVILFLVILLPARVLSQRLYAGLKTSANVSNIRSEHKDLFEPDIRGDFAFYLKYFLNRSFYISPEIQYSAHGFYSEYYDIIVSHPHPNVIGFTRYLRRDDYYLQYIKMPLRMGIKPFGSAIDIQAGFYLAYLLNARLRTNKDFIQKTSNITGEFETIDFGCSFAILYESKSGFNFGVQIDPGIRSVLKQALSKSTNFNYSIGIGYTFGK